jgi:hypothetical protein
MVDLAMNLPNWLTGIFKKPRVIVAVYYHGGTEFFRERWIFKNRFRVGQGFTMNRVPVEVLKEELEGDLYKIHCSRKWPVEKPRFPAPEVT